MNEPSATSFVIPAPAWRSIPMPCALIFTRGFLKLLRFT